MYDTKIATELIDMIYCPHWFFLLLPSIATVKISGTRDGKENLISLKLEGIGTWDDVQESFFCLHFLGKGKSLN